MRASRGFTLLELMIVVGVIAILAAISIPSYLEYSRKGKRAEAATAIGDIQLRQERWRADNPTYGTMANLGAASSLSNYDLTITLPTATGYTVTATRKDDLANDPKCGNLTMTVLAGVATRGVSSGDLNYCWRQ